MPKKKLNYQWIQAVKPADKVVSYYDTMESGLILRVLISGRKSFSYRYKLYGKSYRYNIGPFPDVSLSDARKKVKWIKAELREGRDPQRRQKKTKLFEQLADIFKDKYLRTLRDTTATEYRRIIDRELLPVFSGYQLTDITKDKIMNMLDDKAYGDGSPTMANRIRARLSTMFSFAIDRGLADSNPVSSTPTYKAGKTKRDRFYSEDEIQKLWAFFNELQPVSSGVVKMLLVCGQRKTETMKMRWDDISDGIWTIPAEIAKNGQPHDVPLSDLAQSIIEDIVSITGDSDYVFCSPQAENKPIKWLTRASRNIKKYSGVDDFRPHDLRRTVASHMSRLGVGRTVVGKILNHKGLSGDGQVTAIYDRHSYSSEKRKAMNQWAEYLQRIIERSDTKIK